MGNDEYKQLTGFLEKKFAKVDERFDKVDEKFAEVDKRFDKVDEKFAEVDERFDKVDEKFAEARLYTDEKFEESKRYFGVLTEELRGEIRVVAEGHGILQRQIENLETKVDVSDRKIENIRIEIAELRRDNEKAFKDLLAAIKFSYADLDQRMTSVEAELQVLRQRVERLEAR